MEDNQEICQSCINNKVCKGLCPPLIWVNGAIPLRETILTEIFPQQQSYNYNETLSELIEDKRERTNRIKDIHDIRSRAIAAMLAVGLTKRNVTCLLKMSYRQILRITNNNTILNK